MKYLIWELWAGHKRACTIWKCSVFIEPVWIMSLDPGVKVWVWGQDMLFMEEVGGLDPR